VPAATTTAPAPTGGSQDGSVLDQLDQMSPAPDAAATPPAPADPAASTTPQVPTNQ
jgi:hypothetical protein